MVRSVPRRLLSVSAVAIAMWLGTMPAQALEATTPYTQALAEAAAVNPVTASFYAARDYAPLWTGPADVARRQVLLTALDGAAAHGLAVTRYDAEALRAGFAAAVTEGDRGRLEMAMTEAYLAFAADLSSGVLVPKSVDGGILREVTRPDPGMLLAQAEAATLPAFLRGLAPKAPEYARLMKEKLTLEARIAAGGFGPAILSGKLEPGAIGAPVVQLRDRLTALGYLRQSATRTYDRSVQMAVQRFQIDNGLTADGVAGASTIEALNTAPDTRLKSVIVAMERLRWMRDVTLGTRHVWVNQPDFTARIIENGRVIFQTRTVIGKDVPDQRSPEFSDVMEHMVINPSWSVPRSITTKEYLPLLQSNRNAVSHLDVIDGSGRVVPRGAVNFAAYSARNFPFALRQKPSDGNALGKVKFMFPNPYNIYLHDTPSKSLFDNEVRAYSHGCIRLGDPFDFAYTLLGMQTDDPKGEFERYLVTGQESTLKLAEPLPVHLVYFTAWPNAKGTIGYRRDIYGRDGRISQALVEAGVVLRGVEG
ncbi:MAG: L,D-transpeptidase family protein [Paracoccaceae bacterium]